MSCRAAKRVYNSSDAWLPRICSFRVSLPLCGWPHQGASIICMRGARELSTGCCDVCVCVFLWFYVLCFNGHRHRRSTADRERGRRDLIYNEWRRLGVRNRGPESSVVAADRQWSAMCVCVVRTPYVWLGAEKGWTAEDTCWGCHLHSFAWLRHNSFRWAPHTWVLLYALARTHGMSVWWWYTKYVRALECRSLIKYELNDGRARASACRD